MDLGDFNPILIAWKSSWHYSCSFLFLFLFFFLYMAVVVHISVLVCYHECLSNFISLCSLVWSHVCYCFLSPIVMNPNAISYCHCVWSHIYIYRYQCCDAISRIRSVCLLSRPWLYIYTSVFTVRFLVSWFGVYTCIYITYCHDLDSENIYTCILSITAMNFDSVLIYVWI